MFDAILIEKDDAGYRATLQQLQEAQLPEVAADLVRRRVGVTVAPGSTPAAIAA